MGRWISWCIRHLCSCICYDASFSDVCFRNIIMGDLIGLVFCYHRTINAWIIDKLLEFLYTEKIKTNKICRTMSLLCTKPKLWPEEKQKQKQKPRVVDIRFPLSMRFFPSLLLTLSLFRSFFLSYWFPIGSSINKCCLEMNWTIFFWCSLLNLLNALTTFKFHRICYCNDDDKFTTL